MKYSLIVDLGNTAIKYAVFAGENLICQCKIVIDHFDFVKTKSKLRGMLEESKINASDFDDSIIFSVVPALNRNVIRFVYSILKIKPKVFHVSSMKELPAGVPQDIGADLLSDIIGGHKLYGAPLLIADLGTVSKFLLIGPKGELEGCAFMPGLDSSLKAMTKSTALLPKLRTEKPENVFGLNTIECMQSGTYYSTLGAIRFYEKIAREKYPKIKVVVCGGYSTNVEYDVTDLILDPFLSVKGMNIIRLSNK